MRCNAQNRPCCNPRARSCEDTKKFCPKLEETQVPNGEGLFLMQSPGDKAKAPMTTTPMATRDHDGPAFLKRLITFTFYVKNVISRKTSTRQRQAPQIFTSHSLMLAKRQQQPSCPTPEEWLS